MQEIQLLLNLKPKLINEINPYIPYLYCQNCDLKLLIRLKMKHKKFIQLNNYKEYPADEMLKRSQSFFEDIKRRRTVRDFSDKPIPKEIIENCIKAAGTAPSGANLQPWHFVVVSNPEIKKKVL